jgi:hypothetical protein
MKRQMKINTTRRSFTRALIGITAATPMLSHSGWDLNDVDWKHWGFSGFNTQSENEELWLSAQGQDPASYSVGWINPQDESSHQQRANFRGHGLCQNPTQPEHVVMFSRRPGTQGIRLNTRSGDIDGTFHSEKDRHMQGHGCYSADGKLLYCAESSISSGEGKITVRDAETLKQVNEFNSYGIGPHEILLMPDGHTLVIANGGLLTHPDSGRKILNLSTMRSSLTYIDSRNGDLISEHFLTEAKASIRHIAVASDGTVAIGLQVQREAMNNNDLTPLAAIHKPGQPIKTLQAPTALMVKLNDYIGSVAIHSDSRIAAFASPKGDLVMFWHLDDLSWQNYHAFHDVCGLTISQDNKYFILSNSAGKIRQINARSLIIDKQKSFNFSGKSWDNHMISISSKHIR